MLFKDNQLENIRGGTLKEWIKSHKIASSFIGVGIGLLCIVGVVAIVILKKAKN